MTVNLCDVGGLQLAIAEAGTGVPVLFHPGLGYASWCWQWLTRLLADDWRTVAIDPRGTGRSAKPLGPYTIAQLADDLAAVIVARELGPAHVVGHSMGGYVSQALALSRPHLVRSLVLVSTSPGGADAVPVPQETVSAWQEAATLTPEGFARATFPYSFSPGWPEAHPELYAEALAERLQHPTPPDRWRDQYAACEAFLDRGVALDQLHHPVLVVHGTDDRVVPVANAAVLARRLPDARLRLVAGAGHNLMLERPEDLATWITSFLREVGPPSVPPAA